MGKHIELMELFRVQDDKAVEHWDVTQEPTGLDKPVINIKVVSSDAGLSNREIITDLYSKHREVIIHHLLVEDNHIAVHAELKSERSVALFDMFKLEDGNITEHYYVKQEVHEAMMHNNGMF